jgi:hypothetical protein
MNQMNLKNTATAVTNNSNNYDDNWDDDDNVNDDDGGWGDDDDDLDVSGPNSTSVQPPQKSSLSSNLGQPFAPTMGTTTTSSSLFGTTSGMTGKGNMDDEDDFFGGFDNKPAKPIIRPMTAGTGKLVVPVKKTTLGGGGKLSTATPKPVVKKLNTTSNNAKDNDGSDNWDDF